MKLLTQSQDIFETMNIETIEFFMNLETCKTVYYGPYRHGIIGLDSGFNVYNVAMYKYPTFGCLAPDIDIFLSVEAGKIWAA